MTGGPRTTSPLKYCPNTDTNTNLVSHSITKKNPKYTLHIHSIIVEKASQNTASREFINVSVGLTAAHIKNAAGEGKCADRIEMMKEQKAA